jgi:imidazolonepropionase-like amidohydrolase
MWPFLLLAAQAAPDHLLLRDARLWDGTGAAPVRTDILVHGTHIEAVAPDLPAPDGASVVDLGGRTVLPGLIDSHVHVTSVPGGFLRDDTDEERWAFIRHQLRSYVANGVTTVLDCAIAHHEAEAIRAWTELGHPSPDLRLLGIPLSPPDGYIRTILDVAPTFGTPDEIRAHLDALVALDAHGTKLTMEEGFLSRIWPLHTPEMRQVIRDEARARDLPIFVHAMSDREYQLSLDMGVYAMVHPVQNPSPVTLRRLAVTRTWVMSTITIADMFMVPNEPAYLAAPHVVRTVPEAVLATARDPEARILYKEPILDIIAPRVPRALHKVAKQMLDAPGPVTGRVRHQQRAVKRLHDAGVRVVMGSDAGNWPQIPYSFHGPSTLREVALLEGAGFSPAEALLASTAWPAEMLGLEDEIGRVLPGMRADLVVVDGDPLTDLSALTRNVYTVRAGELRSPDDWMAAPDLPAPPPVAPEWLEAR